MSPNTIILLIIIWLFVDCDTRSPTDKKWQIKTNGKAMGAIKIGTEINEQFNPVLTLKIGDQVMLRKNR